MPDDITVRHFEEIEFYGSYWVVDFPGGSVLVFGDDDNEEALARRLADHLATLPAAGE